MGQEKQRAVAIKACKQRRLAIDVGANVGEWTEVFLKEFDEVFAFEPVWGNIDILVNRIRDQERYHKNGQLRCWITCTALGDKEQYVTMSNESFNTKEGLPNIGAYRVLEKEGSTRMAPLDNWKLQDVDLIKIDTEGSELRVIKGGEETIKKWRPVICLEQKNHRDLTCPQYAAKELLESWGYFVKERVGDDWIMVA